MGAFVEHAKPSATDIIHDKICLRILPSVAPVITRTAPGTGGACDGCNEEISPNDLEHELVLPDAAALHFHAGCALAWDVLRSAYRSP